MPTGPKEHYDGVITFSSLIASAKSEARGLIHQVAGAMAPATVWLVSEFAIHHKVGAVGMPEIWNLDHVPILRLCNWASHSFATSIERLLTDERLRRSELEEERWGLIRSEVWRQTRHNENESFPFEWSIVPTSLQNLPLST